jgi:SnoaL-like domain
MERALFDRIALEDLITAYAVAIDSGHVDTISQLATADAVFDYTSSGGPVGDVPTVQKWLTEVLVFVPQRQHLIVNRRFTIDGDEARCEAYFFNPMQVGTPGQEGPMLWNPGGGHYRYGFRRLADGWRFSSLVMEETWRVALQGSGSGR